MVFSDTPTVPVVDITPLISNTELKVKQQAAKELVAKLSDNGCVGIIGHGVNQERLDGAFAMIRRLFDLPYEDKMKAPHPAGIIPHRGYSGPGREQGAGIMAEQTEDAAQKAAYSKITDYKESYEVGSEQNSEQYNIWLPEATLPGFRKFSTDLFWNLKKTSDAILEALIVGLNLTAYEAQSVKALHTGHNNQLRFLHYPHLSSELSDAKASTRLGDHTDWTSFTLLFQDSEGGLEFKDRKTGQFLPATPQDGVVYMNIGDMFMRLSNDVLSISP